MSADTDRIEDDINQSRNRLNDTLEAMGSRLSPGQMLDEALGLAQGQAGQFAAKLGRQMRDNPLPTVLIAAGIAMLMRGQSNGLSAHVGHDDWHNERRFRSIEETRWSNPRRQDESDDAYHERVHGLYAKALDLTQGAGEAVHDFKQRIGSVVKNLEHAATRSRERLNNTFSDAAHMMQDGAAYAGNKATDLKHKADNFYAESPLAAGAIALAIGALIGSATPLSDMEREGLADIADSASAKGANLAERAADKLADTANAIH